MTIGRKLILWFLLVAILVGFAGYIGINYSKKVGEIFKFTREVEIPSLVSILQIESAARQASIKAIEYSIRGDERDRKKTEEALVKMDTRLDALKKAESREGIIDIAGSHEAAAIKKIEHMVAMFKKDLNEFITLKDKGASIEELFEKEAIAHNARKDLINLLYDQIDYQHEELNQAMEIINRHIMNGFRIILLIEDEDLVLDVMRPILEGLGYHILTARNGSEAIYIARTFDGDIDLAVMDIVLPDIEGDKLYPLIMEARPNLKVIVCSGYALDEPAQEILDSGAQDFIQKPFSVKTLSEKVRKALMETKLV